MKLRRYWFEFNISIDDPHPTGMLLGCGVTAYSYADALELLRERMFRDQTFPQVLSVVEDVDISTLDANHVLPNMGIPVSRGIWFPLGYA